MPAEKLSALEAEYKETDEANKLLAAEVKSLGAGESGPRHLCAYLVLSRAE